MVDVNDRLYISKGITVPNLYIENANSSVEFIIDNALQGVTISGDYYPAKTNLFELGHPDSMWASTYTLGLFASTVVASTINVNTVSTNEITTSAIMAANGGQCI